jgi:acetoin utilization deacetylase AcuC-like enzyme
MHNNISINLVTDSACLRHDTGSNDHPELPQRLEVIEDALNKWKFSELVHRVLPQPASRENLMAFHTEDWLFRFEEAVLSGKTFIDHPDNQVCYESYSIATLSAGAGITGVQCVEDDKNNITFVSTRPPGHHAEPNMPFGFCFFNNSVIAARYWQQQYQRKRICVFDFDAHHGNGIQTAFDEDPDAAYISIHEHPSFSYPGTGWPEDTGIKEGRGTILNLPLLPGASAEQVQTVYKKIISFLEQFKPEILVVSAGFDAHSEDDMSGLAFTTSLYKEIGKFTAELADDFCDGRMLSILEGGYQLDVLGESVTAYLEGLIEHKNNNL